MRYQPIVLRMRPQWGVLIGLAIILLTIALTRTPWHLGQGEEKKPGSVRRFIEPLELFCESQMASVRAL